MKKMARVLSVLVLIALVFSMMACSANTNKKIVVGFSQVGAESDWRTGNTNSIKEACAAAGFELKFSDAQQKQENQIKALRSFIAQKVDYIALAPVVKTGWDTVLKEIADAKIPLILVDRGITTTDGTQPWATLVGENFYEEGKNLAQWVKDNEEKLGFKDKDKVNVYQLEGTVGSDPAIDRGKAWADTMKGSKFVTVKSQTGDFTRAKGQEVMESWLKSDKGQIDLVFAQNDEMGLGAIPAIEAAGLKPGKDIKIVTIDGGKAGFQAMVDGKIECIAECSPFTGPVLVDAIKKLQNKEKVDKAVYAKEGIFPKEEAAKELPNRKF